jgi:hypothetical protein
LTSLKEGRHSRLEDNFSETISTKYRKKEKYISINQRKMRIAGATLILALLLSTTICKPLKGEENRDQEAEDDPATENFYFWVGIVFVIACFVAICTVPCCIMCCFC